MLRACWRSGVLVAVVGTLLAAAQENTGDRVQSAHYTTRADMVLVNATVLDSHNRPMRALTRDDFRLFDNKTEQKILYFGEEDVALSLIVLFDVSGSMASKLNATRRAVADLLTSTNVGDEFALVSFSDRPEIRAGWTENAAEVQNSLLMMESRGRTSLLDAIGVGLELLKQARNPRRAMVLLTDGADNNSRYKQSEIMRMVEEKDIQIYAMDLSDPSSPGWMFPEQVAAPALLTRLCERAGGRYFRAERNEEIASIAERIGKELRSQYVLGYMVEAGRDDGRFHNIQLRIVRRHDAPALSVYARQGYRVPND